MMTRMQRVGVLCLCVAVTAAGLVPALLRGAAPAGQAGAAGTRSQEAIFKDLIATQEKIAEVMPAVASLKDPAFRSGDGQKVVPLLKQMVGYMRELEGVQTEPTARDDVRMNRYRFMGFAAALGDADMTASLEAAAQGKDKEATSAAAALVLGRWLVASKDADAQAKLLENLAPTVKANPKSEELATTLAFMANTAASTDVLRKVTEVVRSNVKVDGVESLVAELDGQVMQRDMVGKPFAFGGRTTTGGTFASQEYAGKVVLLDFWATWCVPCIEELPKVKALYTKYHDQGLEVVGISCDGTGDAVVNKFTAENQMPWKQLREASQTEEKQWHPLALKLGVTGIPQMFLVDRKGVLRYVDAREDLAAKVEKLMNEKDTAATKPAN